MRILYWQELDPQQRAAALARPAVADRADVAAAVSRLIGEVRATGDAALLALTERFDGVRLDDLAASPTEFAAGREFHAHREAPLLDDPAQHAEDAFARSGDRGGEVGQGRVVIHGRDVSAWRKIRSVQVGSLSMR